MKEKACMSGLRGKQKDSYTPEDLDDLLKAMTSISNPAEISPCRYQFE